MSFVSSQDEFGDNRVYDFVLTLGHATPQDAKDAAIQQCMERAVFPDPSSTCFPQVIDHAYFAVIERDTEDGSFQMIQFNDPRGWSNHRVRRPSGRIDVCSSSDAPDYARPCFRLVAYDRNGIWPD